MEKTDFELLEEAEKLLPRLKNSVLPSKILKWFKNFDSSDIDYAIDILTVYEFITYDEFLYRINDLLKDLFKNVKIGEKVLVLPYGKVGKSSTLVTYPLKNTTVYKNKEKKEEILISHDYINVSNPSSYSHIIFVDDFIGSGKTFHKEYKGQIEKWIKDNGIKNVYILSTIIMKEGKEYLEKKYSYIKIYSDVRLKIFNPITSPLAAISDITKVHDFAVKYGGNIAVTSFSPYVLPYGYSKSESLISYFHCTPNNTLPIIWGDNSWNPIFPRRSEPKMKDARMFKKDIAFMMSIYNRLGIDLFSGKSIIIKKEGKSSREIKYNSKLHHSIVALIKLKKENYEDLRICHVLGLTMNELDDVYREAVKLGLIARNKKITAKGTTFINELYSFTRPEKFRKESEDNLKPKNAIYLPKKFKGQT